MNARRRTKTPNNLPGRVYPRDGSWYFVPVIEGKPKWIRLCRITDGEPRMLDRLAEEKRKIADATMVYMGNMPKHVKAYIAELGPVKSDTSRKEWGRQGNDVLKAFRDWNVDQLDTAAVHDFLKDNWPDKLHMQRAMRAWLSGFFGWCILRRLITTNPCRELKMKKPKARKVYITDADFMAIRTHLAVARDGKPTPTGDMMQCFVDLCYLTAQRSTDVRLLRWSAIEVEWDSKEEIAGVIHFEPSKTEDSSGAAVDWPVTQEILAVLSRAKKLQPICDYVIRDKAGKPKSAAAVRDAWNDACDRAGLKDKDYTIKDIRAKALTDGKKAGHSMQDLQIAGAHTNAATTAIYIKQREVPVSNVKLKMPTAQ
ncbi:Phage integrase family protein [Noviherbaspirillum humi]|uniref:Phage integrase family protein n=1 Tax=Noviherbaspirillum humi TaxID=1688639 RepID=A0A239LUG9_9BURK|nr:tyrosine-type recombinase/integrase [Noviherbaspirillum humi]SNT33349.1 Phage integrase family protein [Noviherbaspirillum humi]